MRPRLQDLAALALALVAGGTTGCGGDDAAAHPGLRLDGHLFLGEHLDRARAEAAPFAGEGLPHLGPQKLSTWRFASTGPVTRRSDDGIDLLAFRCERGGGVVSPEGWRIDAGRVDAVLVTFDPGFEVRAPSFHVSWRTEAGLEGQKLVQSTRQGLVSYRVDFDDEPLWSGTVVELAIRPEHVHRRGEARLAGLSFRGQVPDLAARGCSWAPVEHADERHLAVACAAPGRVAFPLAPSGPARLHVELGVLGPGARLRLSVAVLEGDRRRELLARDLSAADGWEHHALAVPELADGAELVLAAERLDGGSGAALALWGDPTLREVGAARPPDVFLYLVDTLRADHTELHGYERTRTPNLFRLASSSVTFETCISQGNWTLTSMPSLLTSTFVSRHGVPARRSQVDPELPTLAELLRARGYRTGSFITNRIVGTSRGLDRGFSVLRDFSFGNPSQWDPLGTLPEPVLPWIEEHLDEPLFVYVHTLEPHHPYEPGERYRVPSDYGGPIGKDNFRDARTPEEIAHVVSLYDGEIQFMDESLGRFLDGLERLERFDRGVFVFTSDHGEQFREHGQWTHAAGLHQHQVHVPLVVHLPGGERGGTRETRVVRSIDVLPTVLGQLGLPAPPSAQGIDLFDADAPTASLPGAVSEGFLDDRLAQTSVVVGGWKAIRRVAADGTVELEVFDLRADPREGRPLELGELPEGGRAAVEALDAWVERLAEQAAAAEEGAEAVDSRDVDDLQALGYIE